MLESKRRRPAVRGWKAGTPAQLLGMSSAEARYVDLRLRLAAGLRLRRERQQLTQSELARAVHSSQSRIAKMEAGDPSVSLDLLVRSLLVLGTSDRHLARLIG